jgi:hypothetical protein
MTINASRKGKRAERRVVNAYKAADFAASRDPAKLEADGRATGVDVRATVGAVRFAIQVRDRRRPNVFEALADAQAGAVPGELPIAHVRRINGPWPIAATDVVVIGEADWLALLARMQP